MQCAAVWQHSSNSNIKIVHNSIEHFLWNLSDLFFDDVLCCLWIVFTKSVFEVPPQKIVRRVEFLGIGWPGVIGLMQNGSVPQEFMPEVFKCSVWEMRWCLISQTEQNRTLEYLRQNFLWGRLISHQTDWPSYSQDLHPPDYSLRGYLKDRVSENNPQTRLYIVKRQIELIPQEMLNRIVNNLNNQVAAVLPYSSAVHGTNSINYWKSIGKHYWFYNGFHQKNSINFQ